MSLYRNVASNGQARQPSTKTIWISESAPMLRGYNATPYPVALKSTAGSIRHLHTKIDGALVLFQLTDDRLQPIPIAPHAKASAILNFLLFI